jgi:hypothetical protein
MSKPFLIVGLPRSRTAWWSVAASTPVSCCTHEPLSRTACFADLLPFWNVPGFAFAGISDSGLALQVARILAEVQPRTLIIRRDPLDVIRSSTRYFVGQSIDLIAARDYVSTCRKALAAVERHPLVKVVEYDDLTDTKTVLACFDWLMPGQARHFREDLMHMNIQVDPAFVIAEAARPHNLWHAA